MKKLFLITLLSMSMSCISSEEVKLAMEGAPNHITSNATYMVWSDGKFLEVKKGSNSFTCLVLRDGKGRFEPSCLNRQAVDAILPVYEYLTRMLEKGVGIEKIHSNIEKMAKLGSFTKPEAGALVYMMSKRNKYYDHFGSKLYDPPPHIMLFYPKLISDEIGLNGKGGLPMFEQSFPHLSVIMVPIVE